MRLFDLLKERGFFVKDLKSRFANKQILVNGEPVDINFHYGN